MLFSLKYITISLIAFQYFSSNYFIKFKLLSIQKNVESF